VADYFENEAVEENPACWTINLPVGGTDWIELTRPFDLSSHATAVAPFATAIRNAMLTKVLKRPVADGRETTALEDASIAKGA